MLGHTYAASEVTGVPMICLLQDDFALAKALQEQERAFLMLQGGLQGNEGW